MADKKQSLGAKIKGLVIDFKDHWKVPSENNTVANKEMVCFAIGGMGIKSLQLMLNYI